MENSNQFLETVAEYDQDSLRFQKIEFANKLILNVLTNDIMDTTLDIPLSTQATINDGLSDEDSLGVEPVVLGWKPAQSQDSGGCRPDRQGGETAEEST